MNKRLKKLLIAGLLICAMISNGLVASAANGVSADSTVAYSKFAYATSAPSQVSPGVLRINALTAEDGAITVTTPELPQAEVDILTRGQWAVSNGSFIEICYDSNDEVITFKKLYTLTQGCYFDTMKYGVEFSPTDDGPGNLLSAGWLLDKTNMDITVGDTNNFNEVYAVADDVNVYEINTSTKAFTASTFDAIPVTQKTDGEFYKTANRQMVIVAFDKNYLDADTAKVVEIYYLTPKTTVSADYLIPADTMPQYSFFPDTAGGGAPEKPQSRPWIGYTKPFEMVPGKMYYVGDNEVTMYLLNTDDGLVLFDGGWPNSGYQYWSNIEAMGYDPRDIKHIILSHGHIDHYGIGYELKTMIQNAGKTAIVYESYEDTVGYNSYGYPEVGPTLNEPSVKHIIDEYIVWEKWMDFGNGVRLYPIMSPGHTPGTTSVIFEITPDGGEPLRFGYMGGFGTIANASAGYTRLAYVHSVRYLQQFMEVDYTLTQHAAHYPLLEINKAAELAGIPFLEAMVPGDDEWCNYLERRLSLQTTEKYNDYFRNVSKIINVYGTEYETQIATPNRVSNEVGGPWKRDGGEYKVTLVDSGKLLHGHDVLQSINPKLDGVYNDQGQNLGNGIIITRDGYCHDPDSWFIQIALHVDDDYKGEFKNLVGASNGPVEAIYGDGWFEILRTLPFDSKEEAEEVLATLQEGQTYTVSMDKNSWILIPDDHKNTFRTAEPSKVALSTDAHNVVQGDYVNVSTTFVEQMNSNATILTYTFDSSKFDFVDFKPAEGVTIVNTVNEGNGVVKVTVISMNYDFENLGIFTLRAKENAQLKREYQSVSLSAEYVYKDEADVKEVLTTSASTRFTTIGWDRPEPVEPGDTDDNGIVDLLDLSNIIDWFGFTDSHPDWETLYTFFDFNNDGEIDISDIAYVARLIK